MKHFTKVFLVSCLMMLCSQLSWAEFRNFSILVDNSANSMLTDTEKAKQGTAFTFGVAVADDGTVTRVEKDAANSVATVSGKSHNDHGSTSLKVVVPVEGKVKISEDKHTLTWNAENEKVDVMTYLVKINNEAPVITTGTSLTIDGEISVASVRAANVRGGFGPAKTASTATAIKGVEAAAKAGRMYNVAGLEVDASYKGIVIKDGVKYVK